MNAIEILTRINEASKMLLDDLRTNSMLYQEGLISFEAYTTEFKKLEGFQEAMKYITTGERGDYAEIL